jgi:tripartite-type tricarboxylate transporter receptor subunit TctC
VKAKIMNALHWVLRALIVLIGVAPNVGAAAEQWPGTRPIKLITAAQTGSSPDLTARILAAELGKQTGGTFVVINKAGGNGIPAIAEVAHAAPDGTTLLIGNINSNGLAPALHARKYGFDVKSALQPITLLSDGPSALIASKSAPATFSESLAAWKATPGKYNYFGAGVGSFGHIWFAKLLEPRGLDLLFVPVKGGSDGIQMMREGSVHYAYVPIASFIGQMRSKEIRTLFVTGPTRLAEFPDVPTLKEVGLSEDFEINTWVGAFAPAKTPPQLVNQIHAAFAKAVSQPEVAQRYNQLYMGAKVSASPENFKKFVDSEIDTFAVIAERARIKVDD